MGAGAAFPAPFVLVAGKIGAVEKWEMDSTKVTLMYRILIFQRMNVLDFRGGEERLGAGNSRHRLFAQDQSKEQR